MSEFPDIIHSKIVGTEWDAFWKGPENGVVSKPVLVLSLNYQDGGSEDTQLQKILQACTLDATQYEIIKLGPDQKMAWHRLSNIDFPRFVLLFGVLPQQLGISAAFRLFEPNRFNDRIFIAGPSMNDLEQQPDAKKLLWQKGLKPLFADKLYGNL